VDSIWVLWVSLQPEWPSSLFCVNSAMLGKVSVCGHITEIIFVNCVCYYDFSFELLKKISEAV
jgi:hypothetical protein